MKRAIAAVLAACLLLTACGGGAAAPADGQVPSNNDSAPACTAAQIAWAVWKSQENPPAESEGLTPADPGFEDYLSAYYQLDPRTVEDGYIRYAGGMDAFEIAVLRFAEGTDMEAVTEVLASYRDARAGDFTGYLPEQAALAESGAVSSRDSWAALLLCPRPEEVLDLFLTCLGPGAPLLEDPDWPEAPLEPPETPDPVEAAPVEPEPSEPEEPEQESPPPKPVSQAPEPSQAGDPPAPPAPGVYDGQAVRDAWASGDTAGLSEKSLAVLDAAREVIRENITADMSTYDKELAIHDWMLAWGSYDHDTLSHAEGDQGTPDHENPYGFLLLRKGICSGYSSTFQLFMDLLGIECLTVEGTAHNGSSDHAWNLVRLEGDWYAVDVTWDDPSGTGGVSPAVAHRYFNVTSQFLRSNDHQWTSAVPEAEGTALAWVPPEITTPGT